MMNGMEYTGMDAILAGNCRAAIYFDPFKGDDLDGGSGRNANPRGNTENYREQAGWERVEVCT